MASAKRKDRSTFSALIIGATGLVGNYCLQNLLRDSQYTRITVISQRDISLQHPKLSVHIIDFEKLNQFAHLMEADHIYCSLGTTLKTAGSRENFRRIDFSYPLEIAQISQKKGAKQFILVSALTASSQSRFFYNRVKGELEDAVAKLPYQAILIFRPSLILGNRQERRPAEKLAQTISRLLNPLLHGGIRRYRPTHARVIATAMTEIAKIRLRGVHIFEPDQMQIFYDQISKKDTPSS